MISETLLARFWSQVEKSPEPEGCWLWKGRVNHRGHGFLVVVRNQEVRRAHRLSWEIHRNVTLSSERLIGHKCGNKSCVNPDHLCIVKHSHWLKRGAQ